MFLLLSHCYGSCWGRQGDEIGHLVGNRLKSSFRWFWNGLQKVFWQSIYICILTYILISWICCLLVIILQNIIDTSQIQLSVCHGRAPLPKLFLTKTKVKYKSKIYLTWNQGNQRMTCGCSWMSYCTIKKIFRSFAFWHAFREFFCLRKPCCIGCTWKVSHLCAFSCAAANGLN